MQMFVKTTEGEMVEIVDREIKDGSRPFESVVLTAKDGRTFRPTGGGQAEEITVMPEGETDLETAVNDDPEAEEEDEGAEPSEEPSEEELAAAEAEAAAAEAEGRPELGPAS